jgi:tRNA A37 methylthiotransferase MiaB
VQQIHTQQPQTIYNTQMIIGNPSETEEDFHETLERVARCQFNTVVIFPYDDKYGSDSALLP